MVGTLAGSAAAAQDARLHALVWICCLCGYDVPSLPIHKTRQSLIRFLIALLASAVLLAWGSLYAHAHGWIGVLPSFFYQTLIFLVFSTAIIYLYLYRSNKTGLFLHLYLLTMVVKFIAYGAYNLFVILEDKAGADTNVVFFMLGYFIFTVVEIAFLYHRITSGGER
jgi:hypothetical protein